MSFPDDFDSLVYGEDYTATRWSYDELDDHGHLIWHYPGALPETHGPEDTGFNGDPYLTLGAHDWERVRMVTVDYDFEGEHDYRNLAINPDRPLDPPGATESREGPDIPPYDIDDLATGWKIISP